MFCEGNQVAPRCCWYVVQSKLKQQEELKKAQMEQERAEVEARKRLQEVELQQVRRIQGDSCRAAAWW